MANLILRQKSATAHSGLIKNKPSHSSGYSKRDSLSAYLSNTGLRRENDARSGSQLARIRNVLLLAQDSGNISQDSVFNAIAPLLVFFALLILGIMALEPHTFAHRVLSAPLDHTGELLMGVLVLLCGLALSLGILRALIWLLASCLEMFLDNIDHQVVQQRPAHNTSDAAIPSTTGGLIAGILQ